MPLDKVRGVLIRVAREEGPFDIGLQTLAPLLLPLSMFSFPPSFIWLFAYLFPKDFDLQHRHL